MGGVFAEYGETLADLFATVDALILDPEDQWHKGPNACLSLGELLADMTDAGERWAERPEVQQEWVDLFLRWAAPVDLGDTVPDDEVGHALPDRRLSDAEAERADKILALAVVRVWAGYTSAECDHKGKDAPDLCACRSEWWTLYVDLAAELWLTGSEWRDMYAITRALNAAIDARWTRRERPAAQKKAKQAKQDQDQARTDAPAQKEESAVTTTTMTVESPAEIIERMTVAIIAGDVAAARAALADGQRLHPDTELPHGASWASLDASLAARQTAQAPAPAEATTTTDAPALGVVPPAEESAPESALPTLRLEHTIDDGTRLFGSPKGEIGKRISAIMGKNGQKWWFFADFWYIRGSRPGGADMPRINAAVDALRADGFTVELDIRTRDAQGRLVAPKLSKAESARRAVTYRRRRDSINWHLTMSETGLPCEKCGTSVKLRESKVVDSEQTGLPIVLCLADAGDMPAIELPAEPPVSLVLVDVQDDDAAESAPEPAVAVVESAPEPAVAVVAEDESAIRRLSVRTLLAMVKAGDVDAAIEIERRMLGDAPAPVAVAAAPVPAPRRVAVRSAEPAPSAGNQVVPGGTVVMAFALDEGAHPKHTARQVRVDLYAKVTNVFRKYGVAITVNDGRNSEDGLLRVTAIIGDAPQRKRTEITNKIKAVTVAVRGISAYDGVSV